MPSAAVSSSCLCNSLLRMASRLVFHMRALPKLRSKPSSKRIRQRTKVFEGVRPCTQRSKAAQTTRIPVDVNPGPAPANAALTIIAARAGRKGYTGWFVSLSIRSSITTAIAHAATANE